MRKLREAAVVAAMIGSVSMFGAGAASAHGGDAPEETPLLACEQDAGNNTATPQTSGLLNIGDAVLGGSGDADSSATQQICGLENTGIANTAGDATSGTGGAGGLTLGL